MAIINIVYMAIHQWVSTKLILPIIEAILRGVPHDRPISSSKIIEVGHGAVPAPHRRVETGPSPVGHVWKPMEGHFISFQFVEEF